jgi:hypothetical protein
MVFKERLHHPIQSVFVDIVIEELNDRITDYDAQWNCKQPNPVNNAVESFKDLCGQKIKADYKPQSCNEILN